MEKLIKKLTGNVFKLVKDKKGAGMIEYIIIVLLVIIVGGIFLTLFSGGLSDIFGSALTKIKSVFSL